MGCFMDIFVKHQRTVVQCAGQPESMIDQDLFTTPVSGIHSAKLRERDMGLVDNDEVIIMHCGEIILHRVGGFSGFLAGEMA